MALTTFTLTIESANDGNPRTRRIRGRTPDGREATSVVTLPDVVAFREQMPRFDLPHEHGNASDLGPYRQHTNEQLQELLFETLFQDDVRALFESALVTYRAGLRLMIRADEEDGVDLDLFSLPWEMMRDPRTGLPLGMNKAVGLVRRLQVFRPMSNSAAALPLRMLVVLPEVEGMGPVGADAFQEGMAAINQSGLFEIDYLLGKEATLGNLGEKICNNIYHVVHFTAHCGPLDKNYALALPEPGGGVDYVSAQHLALTMEPAVDHLRLVTLMACKSGRMDAKRKTCPFSSMAGSMVKLGIPAVVATQYDIGVGAALNFSKEFYQELARGKPLSIAVNIGRMVVMQRSRTDEWITPVLYSRLEEESLFDTRPNLIIHNMDPAPNRKEMQAWREDACFVDVKKYFAQEHQADWAQVYRALLDAYYKLKDQNPIVVEGKARLSVVTALGYIMMQTTGKHLFYKQFSQFSKREEVWNSRMKVDDTPIEGKPIPIPIQSGDDELVAAISITVDVENSVFAALRDGVACRKAYNYKPFGKVGREVIENQEQAVRAAVSTAAAIRRDGAGCKKVHLFMAAPAGFALLLGHYLNGHGTIQIYEHQNDGYKPSILLGQQDGIAVEKQ